MYLQIKSSIQLFLGRKFDKDGNLVEWWSHGTIEAFKERAKCFVDQYNNFHPPEFEGTSWNMSVRFG